MGNNIINETKYQESERKTLKEVLLHVLPANVYVEIVDSGWRVGFTYIDYEDLFIHSLSDNILNRAVAKFGQREDRAFINPIYSIYIV